MKVNITIDSLFSAIGDLIRLENQNLLVVQGQDNYVPPPNTDFVLMNHVGSKRLERNSRLRHENQETIISPISHTIQLDFYGKNAGNNASLFFSLWYDAFACDNLPSDIRPLFSTEPEQRGFHSGELNFIDRWSMDITLQINQSITHEIETFNKIDFNIDLANEPDLSEGE